MNKRFIPLKRFALDGKMWWCVWDNMRHDWSTYTCHCGMYKTKKAAWADIQYYNVVWGLDK